MTAAKILNAEQQEAIRHGEGPLLIIAGAGTGKTTVITERISYLIAQKQISPSEILALTFTEKAAREMEERVDIAMPYGYTQMWISTFHAFCDRVLRDDAIHIGLNPGYKLATEAEIILFLRQNLFKFDLQYFRPLGNPHKFLDGLFQHFSRLKDEDISPEEYLDYAKQLSDPKDLNPVAYTLDPDREKTLELAHAYKTYEELKVQEGIMDFGDLISNTLTLFRSRPNVLQEYQRRFKFVLVDEFQDTNFAQNTLAILLAGEVKNITVVGDDDQAIYRWRGAAISNIIHFRTHFPQAKIITLTKNYRSTSEILDASYQLIQNNNPDRLEVKEKVQKKLSSMRDQKGTNIELILADRVENEAERLVTTIQELVEKKTYTYKDIAILVRANDYSQAFVRALTRYAIPYQFLGPGHLFHQEEIKDLIAYLKILYNFEDSTSLYRILNLSQFNIEARDVAALLNFSRRKNCTLFEGLEKMSSSDSPAELFFKPETFKQFQTIYEMIMRHLKKVPKQTAGQILYYFLEDTGLLQKFLSAKTESQVKRYQNIARFFDKLKTFEAQHEDSSVFAVVDWIELSMQMGESPLATDTDWTENNAVNILTVHSSKGLEFPVVFLVNLVTQRFPSRERREQIPIPEELIKEVLPEGDFHLQEERRLFYVGMTRARDLLYFTAANYYGEGKRERKLSPFIEEAMGTETLQKFVQQEHARKVVIQPSLLDWAPQQSERDTEATALITKPTILTRPITYISYSQMQTFELCPLHYKLKYILKLPAPYTAAQSYGMSIHNALKEFYQRVIQKETISVKEMKPLLEKVWIDEGYNSKEHQQAAKVAAEKMLQNYIQKNYDPKKDKVNTLSVELPFQFTIKNPKGWQYNLKVGGRIDRINKLEQGKIEILDYKTSNNLPQEKDLADDLQLTMYALAATEIRDPLLHKKPKEIVLSLYFLEQEKKFTTTRTLEQLELVKEIVFQKAEEISHSDFVCSGSTICRNCEYKMLCATSSGNY